MTVQTRAQIAALIASQFPDNTDGQITPAVLRAFLQDVVDSIMIEAVKGVVIGMEMANDSDGDAAHDIDFAAGSCYADDGVTEIVGGALTKQLDATFAEGTNAGGLDTGSIATDEVYAAWAISKADGTDDRLFSLSFTAPTMPTGFVNKQLIGFVATDATPNIIPFKQDGDHFEFLTNVEAVNDTTITANTAEAIALQVPPNSLAELNATFINDSGGQMVGHVRAVGADDPVDGQNEFMASINVSQLSGPINVPANVDREVEYLMRETTGNSTVILWLRGCVMVQRGRL